MSSISRRSLIGYSGTAAAGAVIAGTASASPAQAAQPAQPAQPAQAAQAESASTAVSFPEGTLFDGRSQRHIGPDTPSELWIKFSIVNAETPAAYSVTPQEIADAINDLLASRGWPTATFYGTPAPAPLS
ncbi:hypothetical protein ABZ595_05505 [Streptomyces rubradiris]|uniref:hypothetical protein n=1 Tax=Streptomyces rubradiris TaxID=285531 RepID=UPI0033F2A4E5